MNIYIRKFIPSDIPYKVRWINDKNNNLYLHYDLPLTEEKTYLWYNKIKNRTDRADYTIILNTQPVGIIGLLNIDHEKKEAEYYICLGTEQVKGKGVGFKASKLLFKIANEEFKLKRIYLFTEVGNVPAQRLFDKLGFVNEGLLKEHLNYNGRMVDRFVYGLNLDKYNQCGE